MMMQPQQQQRTHHLLENLIDVPASSSGIVDMTAAANNGGSIIGSTGGNNNNELIGYYFGSISRETADWILRNHGNQLDGAYLLRSSGPNDDFVLSLMVVNNSVVTTTTSQQSTPGVEVLHYKIIETEDSFVALHGQVGDEKFATIDELIERAQGVATKPRWPIQRQTLESQILPPTYWGLSVYQVCLAFFIKAKQWGFPLLPSLFQPPQQQPAQVHQLQQQQQQQQQENVNTLSIETMRTLIYKSLHEFQPWFHGKISREEAERRIEEEEEAAARDGKFLVRERDTYSYAMCICHRRATKHYRIDVLPTGELAIQDGRKFTSLMALVSHYTLMSDGLWCALTEPCPRPIQAATTSAAAAAKQVGPNGQNGFVMADPASNAFAPANLQQAGSLQYAAPFNNQQNNLYCVPPLPQQQQQQSTMMMAPPAINHRPPPAVCQQENRQQLACVPHGQGVNSIRAPIKEWLQTINQKWSQLMAAKSQQSLNSFLFGNQNPLNNHCNSRHSSASRSRHHHGRQHHQQQTTAADRRHQRAAKCNCHAHHQQQQLSIMPPRLPVAQYQSHEQHKIIQQLAGPQQVANRFVAPQLAADLPLQSGFQLNGNSFVGSPLFAVRAQNNNNNSKHTGPGSQAGSSNSSSGAGGHVAEKSATEEKLISPAQSISMNLNQQQPNQYNANNETIYSGGGGSTAIVNDHNMVTSSSSSSAGTMQNYAFDAYGRPIATNQRQPSAYHGMKQQPISSTKQQPNIQMRGHIMCGQHAGPAYRYTNCQNDENDQHARTCTHLQVKQPPQPPMPVKPTSRMPLQAITTLRAFDDSQLDSSTSSQLMGPAALSKFVQFQDGQCLRTHRDTRSIQLAYLCSQKQLQQQQQLNRPLRFPNQQQQQPQPQQQHIVQRQQQQHQLNGNDIDLMDCNFSESFRVDPKLIKSSSIETLCGAGDDDEEEDERELEHIVNNCKSNAELLQACIKVDGGDPFGSLRAPDDILKPIQLNSLVQESSAASDIQERPNMILQENTTVHTATTTTTDGREKLDYLNKRHDLDELYTALFAQLDASLRAQVELKNKCLGGQGSQGKNETSLTFGVVDNGANRTLEHADASALLHEFDSLAQPKQLLQ